MRSTLERRLEKSAKSLEEQRREKQRKLARYHPIIEQRFLSQWPRSLTHCGKISGKAKTVVKDADVPKSLKVTLRMASNCGVSRFWKKVGRFLVLSCKHVHFCDRKIKTEVETQVQEVQEHNLRRAEEQVGRRYGCCFRIETREDFFYETKRSRPNKHD